MRANPTLLQQALPAVVFGIIRLDLLDNSLSIVNRFPSEGVSAQKQSVRGVPVSCKLEHTRTT
jgi:hypothetical protein